MGYWGPRVVYRAVYTSVAQGGVSAGTLGAILDRSHRNNVRDGLSGLLICGNGRFLQVLEGPKPAVVDCLRRIHADPRHGQILYIQASPVDERLYREFSMGCTLAQDLPQGVLALYSDLLENLDRKCSLVPRDAAVQRLMRQMEASPHSFGPIAPSTHP